MAHKMPKALGDVPATVSLWSGRHHFLPNCRRITAFPVAEHAGQEVSALETIPVVLLCPAENDEAPVRHVECLPGHRAGIFTIERAGKIHSDEAMPGGRDPQPRI